MKKFLLVVDMQNDFITGSLGNEDCKNVVEPIKKLIEGEHWDSIRFTADIHDDVDAEGSRHASTIEGKNVPPHCVHGTEGADIVPELKPFCLLPILEKDTFGSFHIGATIQHDLDGMVWNSYSNRGEGYEIHVVGVCTSICVLSNVAILRSEFPCAEIFVESDCTADTTPEKKIAALSCMESLLCTVRYPKET